jgi:hypothetical protein
MPKEEKAPSLIPEGLDPHGFREKVQRTLDAATSSRMRATLRSKLAAIDEVLGTEPKEEPKKEEEPEASLVPGEQLEPSTEPPEKEKPKRKRSSKKTSKKKKKASKRS